MNGKHSDRFTHLRTGLDMANGVATPKALMRCCIVGVADVIRGGPDGCCDIGCDVG